MTATTQRLVFLGVCAWFISLSGCAKLAHEPEEKYFLVATNTKVSNWQSALAGLSRAGSQLGVKTEMAGPETYDPKAEAQAFQSVVKQKPSGILLSAGDANLLRSDVDAAIAQGVPVITMDSDVEGSKRLLFIGTDNYKAGTMGAKVLTKELHGKGNVVVYTMPGPGESAPTAARLSGRPVEQSADQNREGGRHQGQCDPCFRHDKVHSR